MIKRKCHRIMAILLPNASYRNCRRLWRNSRSNQLVKKWRHYTIHQDWKGHSRTSRAVAYIYLNMKTRKIIVITRLAKWVEILCSGIYVITRWHPLGRMTKEKLAWKFLMKTSVTIWTGFLCNTALGHL